VAAQRPTAKQALADTTAKMQAVVSKLQELGIAMDSEADINAAFARFKDLADRKSEIFDEDILALVNDETVTHQHEHYRLLVYRYRHLVLMLHLCVHGTPFSIGAELLFSN